MVTHTWLGSTNGSALVRKKLSRTSRHVRCRLEDTGGDLGVNEWRMSNVTFQHDTVLSDVHVLTRRGRRLATRLNAVGQPVFVSRFRIFSDLEDDNGGEHKSAGDAPGGRAEPLLDEDGDIDVTRRRKTSVQRTVTSPVILQQSNPEAVDEEVYDDDDDTEETRCRDVLKIEHTMATPLGDVGKQVWRGALLMADYFLWQQRHLAGRTVLELGAGTGLTSVIMATAGATVYCTDLGEDLLSMCRRNVVANSHMTLGRVKVRHLDWLQKELPLQDEEEAVADEEDEDGRGFGWTQQEVAHLQAEGSIIVAADVCYDEQLTDGLFRTVLRLCHLHRQTLIYFAIERRYNFTLRHLRVSCEAYDHFRRHLEQLRALKDSTCHFQVEMLPCDFPQALEYERVEQLELWKVTCSTDVLEPQENLEPQEVQGPLEIPDLPDVPEPLGTE